MKSVSLLKSGLWTTYGAIATRMLAFLSNVILARLLLPSEFGVIGVAYIFWAFGNLFNQGTVGDFIVYKGIQDKRYVNTTYTVSLCIGLCLAMGMVAVSPLAASFFKIPDLVGLLVVFGFNLFLSSAQAVYAGVLTRQMQYRELANSNCIASIVRVLCTTSCAVFGLSYWSFAIGDTACWIVGCALMYYHAKFPFRLQIEPKVKKEVVSYCLSATGSSLGYYVNANCDNFVVGATLGSTSLGYYNLAYQLTMAPTMILGQAFNQVGMTAFAKLEDDRKQENALVKVVERIAFLVAPIFSLIFLTINEQAIALIFGENWVTISTIIPFLLVFSYFRLINVPLTNMLSAKGLPRVNAEVNLQIAPIALLGFFIGAYHGGILGVSIAVAFVLGIVWTIYWWWVGCRRLKWPLMQYLTPAFQAAFMAILAIALSLQIPNIFLRPFLFIGAYLLYVRLLAPQQFFEYQALIQQLFKRLLKLRTSR